MMTRPSFLVPAALGWLLAGPTPAFADPSAGVTPRLWILEPGPKVWSAQGFAEAQDLSGIASIDGRQCLVASDELTAVQVGQINPEAGLVTAGAMVPLLKTARKKQQVEIDIEGVAAAPDRHRYYATGSHGVGKKKGDAQPERYAVYELPVDPAKGLVRREGIRKATLRPWFERSTEFSAHLDRPLQSNGLNIEGLAYARGQLYFALRGPNLKGNGHIIETDAEALFRGGDITCVVHTLSLGEGRGLRDLVACRDGFLLVSGNASAEGTKNFPVSEAREPDARFQLGWWRPALGSTVEWIGAIPHAEGKAEALLVLEETDTHIDLLCLFDGALDGGAMAYRLRRPAVAEVTGKR
jgi:hypothetical protein